MLNGQTFSSRTGKTSGLPKFELSEGRGLPSEGFTGTAQLSEDHNTIASLGLTDHQCDREAIPRGSKENSTHGNLQ